MQKRVRRLLGIATRLTGLSILSTLAIAAIVALQHMLDTPQRLDSALVGEDHIYRWKRGHIFYKALGAADAPPLILLHTPDIGASAYEMRSIIAPLAQYYRVYAPDLIGFGLSDRPQMDYSAETYITLCRDFLHEVVARPTVLVASRLSCNYAIAVAANAPELCDRLVLISPSALFGGAAKDVVAFSGGTRPASMGSLLLEVPLVKTLLYAMLSTRLAYQLLSGSMDHSKANYNNFYATTHRFGAQHAPMALFAGKLAYDASHEFEGLHQPTLIIWGAHALNNAGSIMSQQPLPVHTHLVLLQEAGIDVHEKYPDMVVANIREWSEEGTTEAPKEATASVGEVETAMDADLPVEAFCIKCKRKTEVQNPHEVTGKNGRIAVRGTCSVCGANLYRPGRLVRASENT